MNLPHWTPEGLLPIGAHRASMSDVYDRLVLDAPNRGHREVLYGALSTYLGLVKRFIPHGRAWVDGGFAMQKTQPPHDVDVALLPSDWDALAQLDEQEQHDFMGLITLQDVIVGRPGPEYYERIQPIGGALDGFLCHPSKEGAWFDTWSMVKRDGIIQEDELKGFVEVAW